MCLKGLMKMTAVNFKGYQKILVFNIESVLDWLEDDLKNRPVFKHQVRLFFEYVNNKKILINANYCKDPVYIPGAVVLYNLAISEYTGLSLRQVKRVKEFLSKMDLIYHLRTIKTKEKKFIHLWLLNMHQGNSHLVDFYNGEILGRSDIYDVDFESRVNSYQAEILKENNERLLETVLQGA